MADKPWNINFYTWNGSQYVRNTLEYDLDSLTVRKDSLQIFMREKPKPEDNTSKEKPK